jgi:hypothetical protein
VVIDGPTHHAAVAEALLDVAGGARQVRVLELPESTGNDGWICHRIYGAAPFLVNTEWVCYLDEDNWYDADHLQTLFDAVRSRNASWGFSLRKLYDGEGNFLALDECESLGTLHPPVYRTDVRLVDTNCYLLRRDIAISFCPIWNRRRITPGVLAPDFALCTTLIRNNLVWGTNKLHSVNYTAGTDPRLMPIDNFRRGNAEMHRRYPNGMPWHTPPSPAAANPAS